MSDYFGIYPTYSQYSITRGYVGRPYFYNDKEVGIGWESKIDDIVENEFSASFTIRLSCGTDLVIKHTDLMKNKNLLHTNLEE